MTFSQCKGCGGALKRSRRTFFERLVYFEAHRCEQCKLRTRTASWSLKDARYVKCPRCHSVDLSVLKRRDGIDRMQTGIVNLLNKLARGKLYHCWFCRLQFYDLRQPLSAAPEATEDSTRRGDEPEKSFEPTS